MGGFFLWEGSQLLSPWAYSSSVDITFFMQVYERGVQAIPLSIDLWLSYLTFYKEYVKDSDVKEKRIR